MRLPASYPSGRSAQCISRHRQRTFFDITNSVILTKDLSRCGRHRGERDVVRKPVVERLLCLVYEKPGIQDRVI